jgi:tRNA threonylcarbamoyl adenosine modification protein YeaZ/ribosomal-protein-alanine acetyltransferase
VSGLAIECATLRVEVAVWNGDERPLAHEVEEVGHGHTRRLAPLVDRALRSAGLAPADLKWIAADLGPGSFTGVRVGLATASAIALATGARLVGASSLESLAHGSVARRTLVVPLVEAGRRDVYAGYFRADAKGHAKWLSAPRVGTAADAIEGAREALAALRMAVVRFVGPGAAREQAALEAAFPGSTSPPWRFEGLSALDLAAAARDPAVHRDAPAGAASALQPLYVRPAQAEERVRRLALAANAPFIRPFTHTDVDGALAIERRVFSDPWSETFFRGELGQAMSYARAADVDGRLAGYSMAWLGAGAGHLGNLAVAPEQRRRGVARALVEDLLDRAARDRIEQLTLEVRATNFAAQQLYRAFGFRLVGLRRGYYRDTGEDALVMEWRGDR